jgi:hypothetical protein
MHTAIRAHGRAPSTSAQKDGVAKKNLTSDVSNSTEGKEIAC